MGFDRKETSGQYNKAKGRLSAVHDRCRFYKMLQRCEPCKLTRVARRRSKHAASKALRRFDRQEIQQALHG